MTADAEQMMLGGMATMKKPSYMNWNVNYMNRIKRGHTMGSELLAAAFPLVISLGWFVGFILLWIAHAKGK